MIKYNSILLTLIITISASTLASASTELDPGGKAPQFSLNKKSLYQYEQAGYKLIQIISEPPDWLVQLTEFYLEGQSTIAKCTDAYNGDTGQHYYYCADLVDSNKLPGGGV